MGKFVDETTVMQFYVDLVKEGRINFLKDKPEKSEKIISLVTGLMQAQNMNSKIVIACDLWKVLLEASLSSVSPDKSGYDKVFKFFDAYVEFEELIFASDSFYRDHTLHCIWVYFLGEFIKSNEEFAPLFTDQKQSILVFEGMCELDDRFNLFAKDHKSTARKLVDLQNKFDEYDSAIRCVSSLTHDLGYPLKKIEKINKSIKKVLPFFAIDNFKDFSFEFDNVQQEYIVNFIDLLSREPEFNIEFENLTDKEAAEYTKIMKKAFKMDRTMTIKGVHHDVIEGFTDKDFEKIPKGALTVSKSFASSISKKQAYLNDFENYQHGIMSAFLLVKNLGAFGNLSFDHKNDNISLYDTENTGRTLCLQAVLDSISFHTCASAKIKEINDNTYLTFVDELEEFSRISRASQNREYVKEFCETELSMDRKGWLDVKFIFKNKNLDNLDPEISFKGRCKRFLSLFDIPNMSNYLKIRVTVVGKLENNKNTYVLEVARNHALITINGEQQNIPKYLKSTEYFTTEEYEKL